MLKSIQGVRCFRPNATFYLYPNVTGAMKNKGFPITRIFAGPCFTKPACPFARDFILAGPAGRTGPLRSSCLFGIDAGEVREAIGKLKAFLES